MQTATTTRLKGAALAYAVGLATGEDQACRDDNRQWLALILAGAWNPSVHWEQGGPLIERYQISIMTSTGTCYARIAPEVSWTHGDTILQACMRAIVLHELGNQINLPDVLVLTPTTNPNPNKEDRA